MKSLCIIPARGGSTRLPRKNIREFHGAPIIGYSISLARSCGLFDACIVSTDDAEIERVAEDYGAEVWLRPQYLARNEVGTQAVVADVLSGISHRNPEYACCLYATAPLLLASDLWRGWQAVQRPDVWYAFSCGTNPLHDVGGFYFGRATAFRCNAPLFNEHTAMIDLPDERCCDINVEEDWQRAEALYSAMKAKEAV